MKRRLDFIFRMLSIFAALALTVVFPLTTKALADTVTPPPDNTPPVIQSFDVSSRTVAYQGNQTPSCITFKVKADEPTRARLELAGNGLRIPVTFSKWTLQAEHSIEWTPWDTSGHKPIPAGQYKITLFIQDQAMNEIDMPEGYLTIATETNPKPLAETVSIDPQVISPKYGDNSPLTTVTYRINRRAENVQVIIRKDGNNIYTGAKTNLTVGQYKFQWNGKDDAGRIVPDGDYDVLVSGFEFTNGDAFANPAAFAPGKVTVKDGDSLIPRWRLQQIVQNAGFDSAEFAPSDDGTAKVTGTVTLAEKAHIEVWIVNQAHVHVLKVLPDQDCDAGTSTFSWNGRDFMGGKSPDGPYWIKVRVSENNMFGDIIFDSAKVDVKGSYSVPVPEPVEQVQVIVPESKMSVEPYSQQYIAKQGEILTITGNHGTSYNVLVDGYIPGTIPVTDVQLIGLDKIPVKYGTINQDGVSAYKGPGPDYQAVTKFNKGTQVRILRQENEWYRVLLDSGVQAYIRVVDLDNSNSDQLINNVRISNPVITPQYKVVAPLTTVSFNLARKADVTLQIRNGNTVINQQQGTFDPGTVSFQWNGRNKDGYTVSDGDYQFIIQTNDLERNVSNFWENKAAWIITVKGASQWPLPDWRMKQIMPDAHFVQSDLIPGVAGKDKVDIKIVTTEKADIQIQIVDGSASVYAQLPETMLDPGDHYFTWDEKTASGGITPDGTYFLNIYVKEQSGEYGFITIPGTSVNVHRQVVPDPTSTYTVVAGDTLWKIAQRYGTTVDAIVKANNLNPNKPLQIGQKLVIPSTSGNPGTPSTITYIVQPGDTLWKIAQKYGTTVDAIVKANNLDPAKYLSIGQKLIIPGKNPPPVQPVIYTVQAGDTLWKIAQKYGTTVNNLVKLNQLDPNKPIYVGQQIKVKG